jgi:hypothetical protein
LRLPQAARAFPDVDRAIAALDLEEDSQEPTLELDDWQARVLRWAHVIMRACFPSRRPGGAAARLRARDSCCVR